MTDPSASKEDSSPMKSETSTPGAGEGTSKGSVDNETIQQPLNDETETIPRVQSEILDGNKDETVEEPDKMEEDKSDRESSVPGHRDMSVSQKDESVESSDMGDSEKLEDENHNTEPAIDTKEDSIADIRSRKPENESETKADNQGKMFEDPTKQEVERSEECESKVKNEIETKENSSEKGEMNENNVEEENDQTGEEVLGDSSDIQENPSKTHSTKTDTEESTPGGSHDSADSVDLEANLNGACGEITDIKENKVCDDNKDESLC